MRNNSLGRLLINRVTDLNFFLVRIEQELLARIVSEMNQPAPDPTTLIRPQSTPDSSTVSEPEDEDADMLGECRKITLAVIFQSCQYLGRCSVALQLNKC